MTGTASKLFPKNKENHNRRICCYFHPIDDKLEDLIRMFVRLALYTIVVLIVLTYLNPLVGGNRFERGEVQEKALGAKTLCPPFSEPLQSIIETTSIILAGRFRQRFGKTRLQIRDGYFTAADQKFNATILVTAVYKNDTFVEDLITIGTFFIPTGKPANQPGCLDAFYKNSKYMFFLKKVETPAGYYAMTQNPQLFTEKLAYSIYARRCSSCYAPKIEPISNLEMKPGEQLTITCVAMGKPLPEVAWIKNGKSLNFVDKSVSVEEIKISDEQTESILEISSLIRIDSGEYKCLAHNSLGEASVSFSLQVSQPDKPEQVSMDTELIECPEEHRDYCLNGGQCYMLKSDRNVLQCRCSQQYFGDRCHFHVGGLLAYAEAGDAGLHSMFKEISHEIITHLSWSLWGSVLLVVGMLLYLIYTQHLLKSHLNKAKRSRPTGGRRRQSRSAQGSNLLLGSRAVSCTEFEDRTGLHVNNVVTLPVPTGRMCASEQNIPVDSRSQNPSNVHSMIQPSERSQIMAYGLTGVHVRDTLDPEFGHLNAIPAGNVSYRNAWNQPATIGHKACRDFFDVNDVTYTPHGEPHMLANIAAQMDQAYQDNTMQPQKNPVHIRNQSVCVSAMDVTRVPLMSQQAL